MLAIAKLDEQCPESIYEQALRQATAIYTFQPVPKEPIPGMFNLLRSPNRGITTARVPQLQSSRLKHAVLEKINPLKCDKQGLSNSWSQNTQFYGAKCWPDQCPKLLNAPVLLPRFAGNHLRVVYTSLLELNPD